MPNSFIRYLLWNHYFPFFNGFEGFFNGFKASRAEVLKYPA